MRIIKNGRVYDLEYGMFDEICRLVPEIVNDALGNAVAVERTLRMDKASGLYYVLRDLGGYERQRKEVDPVTRERAMEIAEGLLSYEDYVRHFGDPEAGNPGRNRMIADAEERARKAVADKDYWFNAYAEKAAKCERLEKSLAAKDAEKDAAEDAR